MFSVISKTLIVGVRVTVGIFYSPSYGEFYKARKARFVPTFCKRINRTSTAVGNGRQLLKKGDEQLLMQQNLYTTTTTINRVLHKMEQTTNM